MNKAHYLEEPFISLYFSIGVKSWIKILHNERRIVIILRCSNKILPVSVFRAFILKVLKLLQKSGITLVAA